MIEQRPAEVKVGRIHIQTQTDKDAGLEELILLPARICNGLGRDHQHQ